MSGTLTRDEVAMVAESAIRAVIDADLDGLVAAVDPDAINHECNVEPPAARARGPLAFLATAQWLGAAFGDLKWVTESSVVEGDIVVTIGTMSGRHTGEFVVWTADEHIERVFAPTGRSFSVRQVHHQRVRNGLVVEHQAVRDDQGMAVQAGWVPPTPRFLLRCAISTRRARRAASTR